MFLSEPQPPRSTRTDTLFPSTPPFRSGRPARLIRAAQHTSMRSRGAARHASSIRPGRRPTSPVDTKPTRRSSARERVFSGRSEEHTSELQSLMRTSYAVFCLKKKNNIHMTNKRQHERELKPPIQT